VNYIGDFDRVVLADSEFGARPGARPNPVCFVFHELGSGRRTRTWLGGGGSVSPAPFVFDDRTLFVAYFSSAELGCFLALDWKLPARILDLYVEFSRLTSGTTRPCGRSLLGALIAFGLDGIAAAEKEHMRELILRGGPYSDAERAAILDYCESDVVALKSLLAAMEKTIDLPRALIRGSYMKAVALMEYNGVPIDVPMLDLLRGHWGSIQDDLIAELDASRGIYEGRTFKTSRFLEYTQKRKILWPTLPTGNPSLDDDTFREMSQRHPQEIGPIRELRAALSRMRLSDLQVGPDGRNRCLLAPFGSRTGRNQPSNTKFIFGPAVWLRSLIKPGPGRFVAYVDYSQQELAIAAALSGDEAMMSAYKSGDFYLTFAKQAGAVPADATKESHPQQREQFKTCTLGIQYGMGGKGLAAKLGVSGGRGHELLALHQHTYSRFWRWSDAAEALAILSGKLESTFGWCVHVNSADANPRSLRNFPVQANGAEMIRFACSLATQRGIEVCCPVHDALLVEGPVSRVDEIVHATQGAMATASEIVLPGFPLCTEAKVICEPDRYMDPRGREMWETVGSILHRRGYS